jgi:LPXTG-motif cell wall-anchored protein
VSAIDDAFSPRTLTVDPGETVTWSNDGENLHTVTSDDGVFDSGPMDAGAAFSFTFEQPGTYPYYCQVHGSAGGVGMSGTIVVAGATAAQAESAPTPQPGPQGLPATGASGGLWIAVAAAAIAAGAGLVATVRR